MFQTINPSNNRPLNEYRPLESNDIEQGLYLAGRQFYEWSRMSFSERGKCFLKLAERLRQDQSPLARLMTEEMGKPIVEARAEVEKCAAACEFYAGAAEKWLADERVVEQKPKCLTTFQPLGVVFGIMPWNFPLWQVIRFAAPTMMAGNTVVVKHAPNTWGSAKALAEEFRLAGFPEGAYQDFPIDLKDVESVIADIRVRGVSLTGSTGAGRSVGALAGKHLKKCVLELGGSDAYVILDDADLELASQKAVTARMLNGGQSCIAGKRMIVTKANAVAFTELVLKKLEAYQMGDPLLDETKLGPMARCDLRDGLARQVDQAVSEGAKVQMGGRVPEVEGFYYPTTLLTNIRDESVVFKEEFFGPVASVIEARDEAHALRLANQTSFGLGAAIFSRDVERAEQLARRSLDAGICVVNGIVRSDSRWAFGGIKDSGLGRELGFYGIREFVNIKTVVVD
jgi:succinate-semialdehyde dehydrogenase / glutarate-semialdehyde dehydrogenase